jgi:hypothetical protein
MRLMPHSAEKAQDLARASISVIAVAANQLIKKQQMGSFAVKHMIRIEKRRKKATNGESDEEEEEKSGTRPGGEEEGEEEEEEESNGDEEVYSNPRAFVLSVCIGRDCDISRGERASQGLVSQLKSDRPPRKSSLLLSSLCVIAVTITAAIFTLLFRTLHHLPHSQRASRPRSNQSLC